MDTTFQDLFSLVPKLNSILRDTVITDTEAPRPKKSKPAQQASLKKENVIAHESQNMAFSENSNYLLYSFSNYDPTDKISLVTLIYFNKANGTYKKRTCAKVNAAITVLLFFKGGLVLATAQGTLVALDFMNPQMVTHKQVKLSVYPIQSVLICNHDQLAVLTSDETIHLITDFVVYKRLVSLCIKSPSLSKSNEIQQPIGEFKEKPLACMKYKNCTLLAHGNKRGSLRFWQVPIPEHCSQKSNLPPVDEQFTQVQIEEKKKQIEEKKKKIPKCSYSLTPKSQINSLFAEGIIWLQFYGFFIVGISPLGFILFTAVDLTQTASQLYQVIFRYRLFQPQKEVITCAVLSDDQLFIGKRKQENRSTIEKFSISKSCQLSLTVVIRFEQMQIVKEICLSSSKQFLLCRGPNHLMVCFEEQLLKNQ